jgi:hypothetical protein
MLIFENVFQKLSEPFSEQIVTLWSTEGALTDARAMAERLLEVVFCVRDEATNTVAGVSTASKKKVNLLNGNYFYEFRCYIGEQHRIAGVDVKLSKLTFDFLETHSKQDTDKPIGIITVLQNDSLKEQPLWRRAVWPELEMHFMGYSPDGHPMRVHYFKGARI